MKLPFSMSLGPALAGALAVLGVEFFLVVSVALQFLRKDYDWVSTPLSFYLFGPHGDWLIAAYFALAAALVLIAYGFDRELAPAGRCPPAAGLFVLAAVSVCIVAVAHTDEPGRRSVVGLVHNLSALSAFLSVTLAMLLQSWWLRYDPRWRERHGKALMLAAAAFIALCVYALYTPLPRGAAQKAVILLIVWWLLLGGRWLTLTRLRAVEVGAEA